MQFEENVSLKEHTTLRVGGVASFFVEIGNIEELRIAIEKAKAENLRFVVIGGGSNLLVPDEGFDGLVIKNAVLGKEYEEGEDTVYIVAGAGEEWDSLVKETVERNLYGLENLSGIPGTVGGTPIQNVGAYGVDVSKSIEWVEVFDAESGSVRKLSNEKCLFGYRDSIFKHEEGKNLIVTRVRYRLNKKQSLSLEYKDIKATLQEKKNENPSLAEVRDVVLQIRSKKFPDIRVFGTAGSFFKNPIISSEEYAHAKEKFPELPSYPGGDSKVKIPIAYILERLGYKGYREGNVGFFENHSLVLVNYGDATATEIIAFAESVIEKVFAETKIKIEMEVRILK